MSQGYNGSEVWLLLGEVVFVSTVTHRGKHTQSNGTAEQSQMTLTWLNFKIVILYFTEIEGVLYQNQFSIYLLEHGGLKDVSLVDLL